MSKDKDYAKKLAEKLKGYYDGLEKENPGQWVKHVELSTEVTRLLSTRDVRNDALLEMEQRISALAQKAGGSALLELKHAVRTAREP